MNRPNLTRFLTPLRQLPRPVLGLGAALLFLIVIWTMFFLTRRHTLTAPTFTYILDCKSDHQVHPLTLNSARPLGPYDIIHVENYSSKPLSILAFSSRPHTSGDVLSSWASWIATTRYAILVPASGSWTFDPKRDGEILQALHGHTWMACYYEPNSPHPSTEPLPASALPFGFTGSFRVFFVASPIPSEWFSTPQLYHAGLLKALTLETDTTTRPFQVLAATDLSPLTGLTEQQLQ